MQQIKGTEHLGPILNFVEFCFGNLHYDEVSITFSQRRWGGNFEVNIGSAI
jgi:hypothetical protein